MKRKFKVFLSALKFGRRKNIDLGAESYISWNSQVLGTHVVLGDFTGVEDLYVVGSQKVTIGKYCALGGNLTLISSNHVVNKPNIQAKLQHDFFQDTMDDATKGPIVIGNNVWIGRNVIILPGVTVGDGAIIGAGSVVTKSVPPFAIAVGNPASVKKYRFSKTTIKKLLKDPWWLWSTEKIAQNKPFFTREMH